jgi:putative membrane protein
MYLFLKYLHILAVIGWINSSSSMSLYLIYKTFVLKDENQEKERKFYRYLVYLEVFLFSTVISFGLSLYFLFYDDFSITWLRVKILIALLFFTPMEALNLYFVAKAKNIEDYKRYDKFVLIISPFLILFGLIIIYMAVFKPD